LISKLPESLVDFLKKNKSEDERWYTVCVDRFGGFLQTHGHVHAVEHVDRVHVVEQVDRVEHGERPQSSETPVMAGLLAKLRQKCCVE
jgi:hypothetical protein